MGSDPHIASSCSPSVRACPGRRTIFSPLLETFSGLHIVARAIPVHLFT